MWCLRVSGHPKKTPSIGVHHCSPFKVVFMFIFSRHYTKNFFAVFFRCIFRKISNFHCTAKKYSDTARLYRCIQRYSDLSKLLYFFKVVLEFKKKKLYNFHVCQKWLFWGNNLNRPFRGILAQKLPEEA